MMNAQLLFDHPKAVIIKIHQLYTQLPIPSLFGFAIWPFSISLNS